MNICCQIFIYLYCFYLTEAAFFSDVSWSTAIKLSEYTGYKSVSLLSYTIPQQTSVAEFSFEAKTSSDSCTFREVHVYGQHGSFPLVTPYNESYPEKFYLNRTAAFHVPIQKNAGTTTVRLSTPRPGPWYLAAVLPKPTSDKLKPKGWDKKCMYGMFVIVESQGVDNIEEISTHDTHNIHLRQHPQTDSKLYRFMLPKDTVSYTTSVSDCSAVYLDSPTLSPVTSPTTNSRLYFNSSDTSTNSFINSNSSTLNSNSSTTSSTTKMPAPTKSSTICPVVMILQSGRLPSMESRDVTHCNNQTTCSTKISSPDLHTWTYLYVGIDNKWNISQIQFTLKFEIKGCQSLKFFLPESINYANKIHKKDKQQDLVESLPPDSCIMIDSLGRLSFDQQTFNTSYLLAVKGQLPIPQPLYGIQAPDTFVMVTSFSIKDPTDIGGTLKLQVEIDNLISVNTTGEYTVVYICMMKDSIPGGHTIYTCPGGILLCLNSTGTMADHVYIPYPEAGTWYLGIHSQCYNNLTGAAVPCHTQTSINMDLGISGCLDSQCGQYGQCHDYISGTFIYSSCTCFAGWRGYGCTDGREAETHGYILMSVLLLTLSNLFFIPSICVAIYRRFYLEAAVYLYTMFFSTFYHACDTSDLLYYCMFKYDTLSYADFFCSITSFWVTLMAMSSLPHKLRTFTYIVGVVAIAVAVEYDRHNNWVFGVPTMVSAVIMITSWILQCRRQRSIFPDKRYYLTHFLPGILLAITGLIIFAFFETTENYQYTHSAWHMTISLSIVFLLPRCHDKKYVTKIRPDFLEENTASTQVEPIAVIL